MEYHRTKDILYVKQLLGHKQLKNTEIYTYLISFESDEWHVAHAKNLDEESKLIEADLNMSATVTETKWLYIASANEKAVLFELR